MRIGISCFGAITPIGNTHDQINDSLKNKKSGIRKIKKYDTNSFQSHYAGIPEEGNSNLSWPSKSHLVGEQYYTQVAIDNLVNHYQFPVDKYAPEKIGCFIGTDEPTLDIEYIFEMAKQQRLVKDQFHELESFVKKKFSLREYLQYDPTITLREVHKKLPFSGPAWCHMGLCSASLQAIGTGYQSVKSGRVSAAVVGGISGKVVPTHHALLEAVGVIALNPELGGVLSSRPFDRRRNGYVPAEGGILFMIEPIEEIIASGRKPLLEITGYGSALNGQHIVKPHTEETDMLQSMSKALSDAKILPRDIEYVNAHGTSTVLNDYHESRAISQIFGASKQTTANKSIHGHLIAAAGAMEVLNTLVACQENYIPPTVNLDHHDPECSVDVITSPVKYKGGQILKNSFGMGGLACSVILRG